MPWPGRSTRQRVFYRTAVHDRVTYPKPTLPDITAGAGTTFTDPTFRSRMTRVTDANTRPDRVDRFWATPSGSETTAWNADGTRFWVLGGGGEQLLYSFDPATMATSRLGDHGNGSGGTVLLLDGEPEFSGQDTDLLYGQGGTASIVSYRLSTATQTTLHTVTDDLPGVTTHPVGMSSSKTGQRFAFGAGAAQDTDFYVYTWDQLLGARWLNTSTGQIGGDWGPTGSYTGDSGLASIHNVRLSKNGRWARVTTNTGAGEYIWDIATKTLTSMSTSTNPPAFGGHVALGYNKALNNVALVDSAQMAVRDLSVDPTSFTTTPSPLLSPTAFVSDSHLAWAHVSQTEDEPMVCEMFNSDSTVSRPWDNEIVAINVAGRIDVWRFCHHRSLVGAGFYTQPRPSVSQDGRYAMFSSNWEDTVGTNRTDVFIVELDRAA